MTTDGDGFSGSMARLESLLLVAERELPAPALEQTRQIVAGLLDAHRHGLNALLRAVEASAGAQAVRTAAKEEPVRGLLALHGLHPEPLEARVRAAIRQVDRAAAQLGHVELRALDEDRVVVSVAGRDAQTCNRLARLLEKAVDGHAPEVELTIEREVFASNLVPVERLREGRGGRA